MDSNTKMNASMKDQYVDRFFEAVINGNEDTVRQLLKGTMQKSTDLIMLTLTQSPPSDLSYYCTYEKRQSQASLDTVHTCKCLSANSPMVSWQILL